MLKKRIYLDYAATAPMDKKVFEAMRPYFSAKFGNPMSIHNFGQEAMKAVDNARQQIADFLNCSASEIIFTSGATESNNLVIKGVLKYYLKKRDKPHIIISQLEHPCIFNACMAAEKENLAEVTYLPVNQSGVIKTGDVKKAIKKNTLLISVMYVNNEIGTVQPIAEIGKLIKKINKADSRKIIFHTDAAQAVNYFSCDVKKLNVDLLSLSGHKIYGPKGIGALYIKKNTLIKNIQDGGEQEYGMRSGTHNVPGIAGLGFAVSSIKYNVSSINKIKKLRDYLIEKISGEIAGAYLNGSAIKRSPANANFRFDGVEGEGLALALDLEGIAVSTGSACSTGSLKPSQTLTALGLKPKQIYGSLRITLGKQTTKKELDYTIKKLKEAVKRLRKISGN
ncbi:cysteine desulfurase [bacterium]|nr:cysteine desulfurase [bacterium]